jgi:hypothetical protein
MVDRIEILKEFVRQIAGNDKLPLGIQGIAELVIEGDDRRKKDARESSRELYDPK